MAVTMASTDRLSVAASSNFRNSHALLFDPAENGRVECPALVEIKAISRYQSYVFVITPLLIAPHAVAPDEIDRAARMRRVQAVVVGHDLVALRVGEDLIAAEAVAVAASDFLVCFAAHRVEAVLRLGVLDLKLICG